MGSMQSVALTLCQSSGATARPRMARHVEKYTVYVETWKDRFVP